MHKIVVFDMDGVLVDSYDLVYGYSADKYVQMDPDIFRQISMGNMHTAAERLNLKLVPRTNAQEIEFWDQYVAKKQYVELFKGVKKMLIDLKDDGYTLVLNTSARDSSSVPILENQNIKHYFDFLATKEVSISKVEKFQVTADHYDVDPQDMLFVTDTVGDLAEASEHNVPTIGVTWGFMDRTAFEESGFKNLYGVVDTIEELEDLIDKFYSK